MSDPHLSDTCPSLDTNSTCSDSTDSSQEVVVFLLTEEENDFIELSELVNDCQCATIPAVLKRP